MRVTSRQMLPERERQKSTSLIIWDWSTCMWLYIIGTVIIVRREAIVAIATPKKAMRRIV